MKNSQNEAIKLKAASDILDRNPETSKTQKIQASSFSLSGEDARSLAAALVLGAKAQEAFPPVTGDYVKIPIEATEQETEDAGQRLLATALRQVDEVREASPSGHRVGPEVGTIHLSKGESEVGPAPEVPATEGSIRLVP